MFRRCLWLICLLLCPVAAHAEVGVCGSSAGKTLTSAPGVGSGLCQSGLGGPITGGTGGPWSWYCKGSFGDPGQLCAATNQANYFINWTDGSGTVMGTTPTLTVATAETAATYTAHFKIWSYFISTHGYADMLDFRGGASHSVVLKGDNTVVSWGGTGAQSNLPGGTTAKAIDAGVYHTLIVRMDGTVAGYGVWSHPVAVPDDPQKTDIPVQIPAVGNIVAVAGGYAHSLALTAGGQVLAWGDNYWKQATVPPEAQSGVIAIAAGHHHSLALKDDGTVIGWGRYGEGQVPQGPTPENPTASRIPPQVAGKKIVAIAAKAYHSVALTADGQVICWGANEAGQSNVPSAAQSGVVAIAAGGHHTLALKKDGSVIAWGDNTYKEATVPSYVKGVSKIAAGTYHSYALRGKSPEGLALVAWGQNQSAQCEVPARAYMPIANGTLTCSPLYPTWDGSSTCIIGPFTGYGLSAFVVNGQNMNISTDTAVITHVKDFTDVTVGFSQGAQVSTFDVPALYKSTTIPINSFTASGQGAVTGYAITMTPSKPTTGWSSTPPVTYNVGSAGPHTLYAWAKDAAGNVSNAVTRTVNVDNVAPSVTTFNVTSPVNHYYTSINLVEATDGATGSGVVDYLVKDTQMTPDVNTMGWAARPPGSYSFTDSGTKTLYAWARDAAGNISLPKTATVVVDTTPPRVDVFTLKSPSVTRTVPITAFTATDNTSITGYGLTETATPPTTWSTQKPTSYAFAKDGENMLYAWVMDSAGNISGPASSSVTIDATPPVVTDFAVPAMQKSLVVPIQNFRAMDTLSQVTGYMITTSETPAPTATSSAWKPSAPTSYTVPAPGVKTLYAWAKDAVGNVSAPAKATVNIDTTPPAVAFAVKSPSNSTTVAISNFTATDAGGIAGYMIKESSVPPKADDPGWTATAPANFTLSAPGTKMLYAWAKDPMGNVSVAKSASVSIDTTPPTVTTFTVKSPAGYNVPITAFTGTDNTAIGGYLVTETPAAPPATASWSTLKPVLYKATTSGDKTLYAWVRDTAGNVSASRTATVSVDAEPPVVTFAAEPLIKTRTIPITTFSATDNNSVTGYQITLTPTPPTVWSSTPLKTFTVPTAGVKTLYGWAKDWVGNPAYKMVTVNVDLTPPVVTFKASSPSNSLDVPITLTATDAGGVAGYMVKETAVAPLATADGWNPVAPTVYHMAAPGTKTIYAWAKDQIGNVSIVKPATITIDTTPPVVTAFAVKSPAGKKVPVTSFLASDNIGIGGYLISETGGTPGVNDPRWTALKPTSYDASASGTLTLNAWVKDKAGNVSLTSKSATVTVDAEAPVVTSIVVPAFAKLAIPVTSFTATDNQGVTGYLITATPTPPSALGSGWKPTPPASFAVTTPGAKTLYAWAKDAMGNVSAPMTAEVTVDNKPPAILTFTVPTTSASLDVPITAFTTSTDPSGIAGYLVKADYRTPLANALEWSPTPPASYTFTTSGAKVLYAWVKDGAGNISLMKSARVTVSAPAP